jgi:hypothetical protein
MANSAVIFAFASAVLLLVMPVFFSRKLGHDYVKAYSDLKDLDASVLMLIVTPALAYLLCAGLLMVFFKLLISHKIAGPLFRFEKCADRIGSCDFAFSTRLRPGDQLNGLAQRLGELKDHLDRPFTSAGGRLGKMRSLLETLETGAGDGATTRRLLAEFEEELAGLAQDFAPEARTAS